MLLESERFHHALIQVFGQEKVDAFPKPLMEALEELFDRGLGLGRRQEKFRVEVEGEAERDVFWKEAYDLGWGDCTVESRPEVDRLIDEARKDGYQDAIDDQLQREIPKVGIPKEKTA